MLNILNCVVVEHDLRLVLLAALICFLSCYVTVLLARRALSGGGKARLLWLCAAGASGGFGIWSTHFIAMLAYDAGIFVGYDTELTLASLAVAIVLTTAGLSVATYLPDRRAPIAGGAVFGGGIAAMHYLGMSALDFSGRIEWSAIYVAASVLAGATFGVLSFGFCFAKRQNFGMRAGATVLMALGVVSLHFTGMTAATIVPEAVTVSDSTTLPPHLMVLLIAAIAFSLLFAGLATAIFARQAEEMSNKNARQFALLVQGVSDYAIYMLGHRWPRGELERRCRAQQGL
ncbi:MAG: MHYT domain-containing protein [Shinella sp.]|nr:MHYT domain-containing protein [Shinella sp.]